MLDNQIMSSKINGVGTSFNWKKKYKCSKFIPDLLDFKILSTSKYMLLAQSATNKERSHYNWK